MKQAIFLAIVLSLVCASAFAETVTGYLVDSKCYASEERNVNPMEPFNNHDRGIEIRACRPSTHTKSFTVVDSDGYAFALDASGNAKAQGLIRQSGSRSEMSVTVSGEKLKHTMKVDSISLAQ